MTTRQPHQNYGGIARFLHWLIAGMIVLQFVLAKLAERADHADQLFAQLALLARHKSVGITILGLAIVRLFWRLFVRPPALPSTIARWQVLASHVSHWSLYALLFALPITGWLMSSASAYSVSWFGLFQLPDFVAPDPALKSTFHELHEWLGYAIAAIASVHILAALKHAIVDKDGVLQRMSSTPGLIVFALVIALGTIVLGRYTSPVTAGSNASTGVPPIATTSPATDVGAPPAVKTDAPPPAAPDKTPVEAPVAEPPQPTTQAVVAVPAPVVKAPPPALWRIDFASSSIEFDAEQTGARFTGVWQEWSGDIRFSAERLADSLFDIRIRTARVSTRDADRDATLADAAWFDSAKYPFAYYRATRFSSTGAGSFVAHGELTIKGRAQPAEFSFSVVRDGATRALIGRTVLDRLAHNVGTGEWSDTSSIGQRVTVRVNIEASVD